MNKTLVTLVILIVTFVFWAFKIPIEDGNYRVVSVADGDTIVVMIDGVEEAIRFIGVDTPETHHPSKPEQCYGAHASVFTTAQLLGEEVNLEADPLSGNRDRYDRLLRFVEFEGQDFNQLLIAEGYGFAVESFDHTRLAQYVITQEHARSNRLGLWRECEVKFDQYYQTSDAVL